MPGRQPWDHDGRSRHARGYGAAWVKLRKLILTRDRHLCQPCLNGSPRRITAGSEVDHIVPKAKGGADDPANLQAICGPCHRIKSAADRGATVRPRGGCDETGWPLDPRHPWNRRVLRRGGADG